MAELTVFGFRQGTSLLHRLDVRFKLIFLVLISLSSLRAQVAGLFLLTLILVLALIHVRVSLGSILRDLRYVSVLLVFIFVTRALSTSGSALFEFKIISVTREGLHAGALVCWRLVIVIITGLAFVLTTRPSEIKGAVAWMLRPFPFVPAKRIATMMGLVVRFMPVIFQQTKETLDAQRARGVENRKNPVYRLVKLGIPVLRRTFERADKLAFAMEARCYSEDRTDPRLASGIKDWIALFAVVFLCAITIM